VLLSHLRREGAKAEAIDANLEAYLYLLDGDRLSASAGPAPRTPPWFGDSHAFFFRGTV